MSESGGFVKPVRVTRAYQELAAAIRARIVAGDLADGHRIPSETALASDARVSRPTVREALRTLEEAGYLRRVSPKVLVVRHQPDDQAYRFLHHAFERRNVTFDHVHEALEILGPEMMRLATQRATEEQLGLLRANVEAQGAAVEDVERWNELSREFQLQVAEAAANPALYIARQSLSELLRPAIVLTYSVPERTTRVYEFHVRTLEEMVARDAEAAMHANRKTIADFRRLWEEDGHPFDMPVSELPS